MPDQPRWRRYLRFWRTDIDGDIDEELRFHFESRIAELTARGVGAEEARRQAAEEFGDEAATRRRLHQIDERLERRRARFLWLDAARADLRYAVRGLRASPLFTAAIAVTLAIGIGAATTMYGVMHRLILQPPPHVTAPEQVAKLYFHLRVEDSTQTFASYSYPFYELVDGTATTLAGIAAYESGQEFIIGRGADAELASATVVSAGFWRTLGVRPALGRFFSDEQAHPATGDRVVVLSHALWQRRFGGDLEVICRTLFVKGLPYRVVGVVPRGFRGVELRETELWLPMFATADGEEQPARWHTHGSSYQLSFVVRLTPDATVPRAEAELTQRYIAFDDEQMRARDWPGRRPGRAVQLAEVSGALGGDMQRLPVATVSIWLVGVAGVLLAIACANVAGLLLLRALRRRREISVRIALGMSGRRLAALLLTESALLTVLGALASIVVIVWSGAWVRRVLLPTMATDAPLLDGRMLLVAAVCTMGTALVVGLAPVLQTRGDAMAGLKDGGQHGGTRRSAMHIGLLVAQTALSVVLLVGAGLFMRSLQRIATLDLGLDHRGTLVVQIDFTGAPRTAQERAAFFERALERVRALPGVRAASLAQGAPLHRAMGSGFRAAGQQEGVRGPHGVPLRNYVATDFFEATGMRITRGRGFLPSERAGAPVVVINELLAERAWPGESPLGKCGYAGGGDDAPCHTVVGVVADAQSFGLKRVELDPWYYTPLSPESTSERVLLVRSASGDPTSLEATLRRALRELDPEVPYLDIRVLGDVLNPAIRPFRLGATVFTAFGVLATLLAALGLYASVAYAVTQRTREIGVRIAVGASVRNVIGLVLGDGSRTATIGILLGILVALLGGRWIAELLFDVSPRDPLVYGAVSGGVLLAAVLATLPPARRAAHVDPVRALRSD